MLEKALEGASFKDQVEKYNFLLIARFIDVNLPISLGFNMYNMVDKLTNLDKTYEVGKNKDGSAKTIELEVPEDDLFYLNIAHWRAFYSNDIVAHNLNTEVATYASSSFRGIILSSAINGTLDTEQIGFLKQLEPYIQRIANSKLTKVPLLIEPMDVMAIKKAEDLTNDYQEAGSYKSKRSKKEKTVTTLFTNFEAL